MIAIVFVITLFLQIISFIVVICNRLCETVELRIRRIPVREGIRNPYLRAHTHAHRMLRTLRGLHYSLLFREPPLA